LYHANISGRDWGQRGTQDGPIVQHLLGWGVPTVFTVGYDLSSFRD
jgi:hypothetical protein